jgi:hypothetical protein
VRSLWGPEGRWAVIVKEMIQSGNYFLPTINGSVYFDKPLLSYWIMVPFTFLGGLNETMLRVPGAMAAGLTVLIVCVIGRQLFSVKTGVFAGLFLVTALMFLFWSRVACAEMFNLVAIWAMFWAFIRYKSLRKRKFLYMLYCLGGIAVYLKGPVAPSVVFFTILVFSTITLFIKTGDSKLDYGETKPVHQNFAWILSKDALLPIITGFGVFVVILFLPVIITGSWESLRLMWRENVIRFFFPFDHNDPAYAYSWTIMIFSSPWAFLFISSLCALRIRNTTWERQWIAISSAAILLFFLLSGSRRGYYILPLIPGIFLITAKSVQDWLEGRLSQWQSRIMAIGAVITIGSFVLVGVALLYVHMYLARYSHFTEPILALLVIIASIVSFIFLIKRNNFQLIVAIIAIAFIIDLWAVTYGSIIGERERTAKAFVQKANELVKKVKPGNFAFFQDCTAEVIFYLNQPSIIPNLVTLHEIKEFGLRHPSGLLLIDLNDIPENVKPLVQSLRIILVEDKATDYDGERLAILQFP